MEVYVLEEQESYEPSLVLGIFSSLEKALKFKKLYVLAVPDWKKTEIKNSDIWLTVTEYELDNPEIKNEVYNSSEEN